jgi:signal transduction histidine kinase
MPEVSPSQRLLVLFALVTLVPSALLVAFGWRMLTQEDEIHRSSLRARKERSAALVVSVLQSELAGMERLLRGPMAAFNALPPGAVVVSLQPDKVILHPPGRVLHVPVAPRLPEAPSRTFDALDSAEYRQRDTAAAKQLARDLAASPNASIRAAALIRLARVLRATGEYEAALQTYAQAGTISTSAIDGVPADLFGRWAACSLLADLRRDSDLRREAGALHTDLSNGRWTLTRAVYELHMSDAAAWSALPVATPTSEQQQLTAAVEVLFRRVQRGGATELRTEQLALDASGRSVTVVPLATDGPVRAIVATLSFVEQQWLAKATPVLEAQNLRMAVWHRGGRPADPAVTYLAPSETGLPWPLTIDTLNPAIEQAGIRQRQWMWAAGLLTFAVLVCAGSWIVGRAVSRELAVARLQSDFVAAVSHEFRTPLTTMAQLTEMLLDDRVSDAARQRRYFVALGRQTERLRRLVESLLDFGRMEAGRSPYVRRAIEMRPWITSVVEQFQQDAASRGHHVHLNVPGHPAMLIDGDSEALGNALWNVLDNAAKYSPDASDVWVDVHPSNNAVAIEVRDTGVGIAPLEQRAIFSKFVRGTRAKADKIAGTGLGLAIVDHVVQAHGGTTTVRSVVDEGSTFTITLPAQQKEPQCLAS